MATVAERIFALAALTTPAAGDALAIVDVSDTGMAATGTTKHITLTDFFGGVPVNMVQGNALNIQTDKVRARDGDGLYLVDDGDNGLFIADGGNVFLGDTANAEMTLGLTINQGANDDEILALKSSDVAHGYVSRAETDTYATLGKADADAGGLLIRGFRDADGTNSRAILIQAYLAEDTDTTKSTAGRSIFETNVFQTSGDALANIVADGNIWGVRCQRGGAAETVFILDEDGEIHTDDIIGVGDDWDEWDDLALASDLSRLPKAKFDEMMKYKAEDFERAGLLTLSVDENGNRHAFIKHKAMLQFAMCCFAEVAQKMKRYEQALLSLGAQPNLLEA